MDIYTMDRNFFKVDEIDALESAIWTDRYLGDGDFELSVPDSSTMQQKLQKGQLMGCIGAEQPMILETRDIKDGILKTTGITLTQWLNNRIIRTSADHKIKEWLVPTLPPGRVLSRIVNDMCIGSDYLTGTIPIGIPSVETETFSIPGLQIGSTDGTGTPVSLSVPFGPVYDALKEIGSTYDVGMKIVLDGVYTDYYILQFRTYRGADRTSSQSVNPVIRFSKEMDSFTDISDLESITEYRNSVYTFASSADPAIVTDAGHAYSGDSILGGFDLRVTQEFVDSLSEDVTTAPVLLNILNQAAETERKNRKVVQLVDGQVVETEEIKYGVNFFLGDIVEVEGNTGTVQNSRITEYIRSTDPSGERAYPTLSMIE